MREKNFLDKELLDISDTLPFCLTYKKSELVAKAKGIILIQCGEYTYDKFSFCFVHDMLSQILVVLRNGYVPRIELKERKMGWCNWGDFFEQPFYEVDQSLFDRLPVFEIDGKVPVEWVPRASLFREKDYYEATCKLYKDWVIFNQNTHQYIQCEYSNLMQGKRVLGVLCRGTDYITFRPRNHPIQPKMDEMIEGISKMKDKLKCDYIYVASEEKSLVSKIKRVFSDCVLENKRNYCDEEYYRMVREKDGKPVYVSDALYSGETNYYQRGLEYLSSVALLSKCVGLVAGDCSGSEAAVYMNNHQYENYYVFDLGMYS